MSVLLQAHHLHRYYADNHAVKDVSIELKQGDILALLGPNGAGKSSCMQMLAGTLAPSEGEIIINGYDLLEQPQQAKQHIGYLPDRPPVYPELSVDEYLDYTARLRAVNKAQVVTAREKAKHNCGLEQQGRKLIAHLSKGYLQRVGIAQAIIHEPAIIILDEPTIGLDPNQMREIRQLIAELGEKHGIILSTHILPEVDAVCNRVQIIADGCSVYNRSMDELRQQSQLSLRLEKTPQSTLIESLDYIESVIELAPGHFLLSGNQLHRHQSKLSQYCVEQGWGLLEMSPARNNLEQLFVHFTSRDGKQFDEEAA